jgi:hypothetical protein
MNEKQKYIQQQLEGYGITPKQPFDTGERFDVAIKDTESGEGHIINISYNRGMLIQMILEEQPVNRNHLQQRTTRELGAKTQVSAQIRLTNEALKRGGLDANLIQTVDTTGTRKISVYGISERYHPRILENNQK